MRDHPAELFGREAMAILARVFGDKVEPFTPELELIFAEIDRNPQQFIYDPCRIKRNTYPKRAEVSAIRTQNRA